MPFLWVCTIIMACVAAFYGFDAQVNAKSAPQQAAGAAIALCMVVIPYVFSRAADGIANAAWRQKVIDKLDALNKNGNSVAGAFAPPPPASGQPQVSGAVALSPPAAGMGYCPSCGKLRGMAAAKCVYCGSSGATTARPRGKEIWRGRVLRSARMEGRLVYFLTDGMVAVEGSDETSPDVPTALAAKQQPSGR